MGTDEQVPRCPCVETVILACCLLAPSAKAAPQGPAAGSETRAEVSRSASSAGARATSASFVAGGVVGSLIPLHSASSESFTALSGVPAAGGALAPAAPVVFGLLPPEGDKAGGAAATLLGFHLAAPGAGATSVTLGGAPASSVLVATNTTLSLVTPAGVDISGTPKGPVEAVVSNLLGTGVAADAYTYLPALTQVGEAHVGGELTFGLRTEGSAVFAVAVGVSTAPVGVISLPPFEGMLELFPVELVVVPSVIVPPGGATEVLPIPDNPGLVGKQIDFQGIAIDYPSFAGGAFTNVLQVPVFP